MNFEKLLNFFKSDKNLIRQLKESETLMDQWRKELDYNEKTISHLYTINNNLQRRIDSYTKREDTVYNPWLYTEMDVFKRMNYVLALIKRRDILWRHHYEVDEHIIAYNVTHGNTNEPFSPFWSNNICLKVNAWGKPNLNFMDAKRMDIFVIPSSDPYDESKLKQYINDMVAIADKRDRIDVIEEIRENNHFRAELYKNGKVTCTSKNYKTIGRKKAMIYPVLIPVPKVHPNYNITDLSNEGFFMDNIEEDNVIVKGYWK